MKNKSLKGIALLLFSCCSASDMEEVLADYYEFSKEDDFLASKQSS